MSHLALVALTVVVSLEAFRVLFPKGYGLADRRGNEAAAVVMVAVFASSALTPLLRRLLGWRRATALLVAGLGAWRLIVSILAEVPLGVALAGAVVAVLALTLVLTDGTESMEATGLGVLAGLALDATIRAAFLTWDPVWQRGAVPLVVAVLLCGGLALSAVKVPGRGGAGTGPATPAISGFGGLALGAVLSLEVLFLSSPGFVASSAGISLTWSAPVVLGGLAIAMGTLPLGARAGPVPAALAGAAGLAVAGFLLPGLSGALVVVAVAGGQAAAGAVLGAVARSSPSSRLRGELGVGVGWIVFVLTLLLYQIHFDQPLPFDNRWVVAGAGALAAVAAVGRLAATGSPSLARPASWSAVSVLLAALSLAVVLGPASGVDSPVPPGPDGPLRIVEWNIRQSVTHDKGNLDPEVVASVLARGGRPDIVVLPEAARGWPTSADLDLASWLSRRLGLPFAWGPAAGQQFGTLLLSRLPIVSSGVVPLPVAGRSQGRSLLRVVLDLGDGDRLNVLATHLQHRNDEASQAARMQEVDVVLDTWNGAPRTVLAGDLNPAQGDPPAYPPRRPGAFVEIRAFLDAGFTTAHDLTACPRPTSGRNCSDYILVTPDLRQEVEVLAGVEAFDHRPVVSTVWRR